MIFLKIKIFSRYSGVTLFVVDVFMNIIIMIIVMSGTSLFPAILRGVVDLLKYLVP
jgi:hypothetical protein